MDISEMIHVQGKVRWHKDCAPHFLSFVKIADDLDRLQNDHFRLLVEQEKSESGSGNDSPQVDLILRQRETVYLRSFVLLLCASWEAYVEDLLRAGVAFLVDNLSDPKHLPLVTRKVVARAIRRHKHDLSPWFLAEGQWKSFLTRCLDDRIGILHSPKSRAIADIYRDFLDIEILDSWTWTGKVDGKYEVTFDAENTAGWIDGFIALRGSIAHGRLPQGTQGTLFAQAGPLYMQNVALRIFKLVNTMHNAVGEHLRDLTTVLPWRLYSFDLNWRNIVAMEVGNDLVAPPL
jgi:hypothetical protein